MFLVYTFKKNAIKFLAQSQVHGNAWVKLDSWLQPGVVLFSPTAFE